MTTNKINKNKQYFFPRASVALAEAVKSLMRDKGKSNLIIFVPDYFCNQALTWLRLLPVKLIFYPVNKELKPDWIATTVLIEKYGQPDILILVHYFGFINDLDTAITFCQKYNIKLLEDASHCLFDYGKIGQQSWAVIFSPYKQLPIPQLGILQIDSDYIITKRTKIKYGFDDFKWLVKNHLKKQKILKKIIFKCRKINSFDTDPNTIPTALHYNSKLAIKKYKKFENNFCEIKSQRKTNYDKYLKNIQNTKFKVFFSNLSDDCCPYLLPLQVIPEKAHQVYKNLNLQFIPAYPWPDLPPEVKNNPEQHLDAINLRKTLLTLPVHQDLDENYLNYIITILKQND